MSLRPLSDVVLVKLHPLEKPSELLFTPNAEHQPLRTGTVVRVGPGRRKLKSAGGVKTTFIPSQLKEGERVAFFSAAGDASRGRLPPHFLGEDEVLIREEDVLFVFDGSVKVSI
jgi:co-chaperonin GroES (HSP10)